MKIERYLLPVFFVFNFVISPSSSFAEPAIKANDASSGMISDGFQVIDSKLAEEEEKLLKEISKESEKKEELPIAVEKVEAKVKPAQLDKELLDIKAQPAVTDLEIEKEMTKVTVQIPSASRLASRVEEQKKSIAKINTAKNSLQHRVSSSEARIRELMTQLQQTKEELLLAETEVERLSRLIEARNIENVRKLRNPNNEAKAILASHQKPQLTSPSGVAAPARASLENRMLSNNQAYQNGMQLNVSHAAQSAPQEEAETLPIATVLVDKANLRTGPGQNNSVLLTVGKNSRLVVEKRQGEWYRVIAPTGERAWLSAAVVSFGPNNLPQPTEMGRVKGYSSIAERP